MNAPLPQSLIPLGAALQVLPLADLIPSSTHVQEMRRKRFDPAKLQELADSIAKIGVLQPIVARPAGFAKFEIVAGERRWAACKLAGLATITANVTELTDDQVLEVQLVENLQREGLHEMEEAEGYAELMKLRKIKAEDVGGLVGKSRSYVYGRIKLLALCPEARKAFYAGAIDGSKALLIARIGHHDTQRKALKDITEESRGNEAMSYREAHRHVLDTYMLKLKQAPFDPAAVDLVPKAGACAACPKRTGNQVDLFTDVKDPDVCTDPKCFDDKRQAHFAAKVKALEAKGTKVIAGDAAKKIFADWDNPGDWVRMHAKGGYMQMERQDYIGNRYTTPRALLGKNYQPVIVQHPATGKLIEMAAPKDLAEASHARQAAAEKKAKAKAKTAPKGSDAPTVDDLINARLFERVHAKGEALMSIEGLRVVVVQLAGTLEALSYSGDQDAFAALWGWPKGTINAYARGKLTKLLATLSPSQLGQLAVELAVAAEICDDRTWSTAEAKALFASLGIEPAWEKKQLAAELEHKAADAQASGKGKKK